MGKECNKKGVELLLLPNSPILSFALCNYAAVGLMSDLDFFSAVAEAIRANSLSILSDAFQQEKETLLCEIDLI